MSKKKAKLDKPEKNSAAASPGTFESLGRKLDDLPQLRAAEEAVAAAREKLAAAQQQYSDIRRRAEEKISDAAEKNVGDAIAFTLRQVRQRPALGVCVSFAVGLLCGRIFYRK